MVNDVRDFQPSKSERQPIRKPCGKKKLMMAMDDRLHHEKHDTSIHLEKNKVDGSVHYMVERWCMTMME
jgi:hypothetical protein